MLLEMHCHTAEHSPCSHVGARELLRQVYGKGLQGVVITDHQYLWPPDELHALKRAAELPDYFILLSGQETATSDMGDVLVYGADQSIPKGTSVAAIRAGFPEAALVLAHPYRGGRRPEEEVFRPGRFDAIEIFSSNHSVAENTRGLRDWHRYKFTALAGTDTHGRTYAGSYPTIFDHPIESMNDLIVEIKHGRCRPLLKEIPRAGANVQVEEIAIGTKGEDESRERIIVRHFHGAEKWLSAERAFYIMEEIARNGFEGGTFRVPRLLEDDRENMVLIEQGLRGTTLFEKLVRSGRDEGRYFVRLSAGWLARLHGLRLRITPPQEFLEREPERLARYVERFEAIRHRHARRAREIMEAVERAERMLYGDDPAGLVQGHGDYHLKNIYIGQDNHGKRETVFVAAIDFDSSLCVPPAFDVGTFLAQFANQLQEHRDILEDIPEELFLDAYLSGESHKGREFLGEVDLFRARTDLGIASYLIKVGLGDSENLWRLLVEAEEALTRNGFA